MGASHGLIVSGYACCASEKEEGETSDKNGWTSTETFPSVEPALKTFPSVEQLPANCDKAVGELVATAIPAASSSSSRQKCMGRRSQLVHKDSRQKSSADVTLISDVLRHNSNLQRMVSLKEDHIRQLAHGARRAPLAEGEELMHEGNLENDAFYILAEGTLEVRASTSFDVTEENGVAYLTRPEMSQAGSSQRRVSLPFLRQPSAGADESGTEVTVRELRPRTCIGEISMLFGAPRFGTVTAMTQAVAWCIDLDLFKSVQAKAMDVDGSERAHKIRKPSKLTGFTPSGAPKNVEFLSEVLRMNVNIQSMAPLTDAHRRMLADVAWPEELEVGEVLTLEGDRVADAFFILESGSVELSSSHTFDILQESDTIQIYFPDDGDSRPSDAEKCVRVVGRGVCFGVVPVLYGAPRAITSKFLEKSVVWCIDRANFKEVQSLAAEEEIQSRVKYLENMEVLKALDDEDKMHIANVMEGIRFQEGDKVLNQGDAGDAFYILTQGSVDVIKDGKKVTTLVAEEGVVQYFGEAALLDEKPRSATVVVTSTIASGFYLEQVDFELLGDCLRSHTRNSRNEGRPAKKSFRQSLLKPAHRACGTAKRASLATGCSETLITLRRVGLLGSSHFGPVEHVKSTFSDKSYSLKRFYKGNVSKERMQEGVLQERSTWSSLMAQPSPFVLVCYSFFNEPNCLSMLLEVALGGPLSSIYPTQGFYGCAEHTRYYIAAVVLGLEHVQKTHRVLVRNLKPENIVVDDHGHAKLGNMSLAKVVVGKAYTTCGTPDYMAPEVIVGSAYSRGVDWYAIGIITFELMAGHAPFSADYPMDVYSKIMRGIAKTDFPEACHKNSVGFFIKASSKLEPVDRLAMRPGGVRNVKSHKFFIGFDWDAMENETMEPPFIPGNASVPLLAKDVKLVKQVKYNDDASGWDKDWC